MTGTTRRTITIPLFVLGGLLVAIGMVVLLAPNASSSPDGLERVASDHGIDAEATEHALAGGPLADYGVAGVDNSWLGTALAGVAGVAATFLVGAGVMFVVRRARRPAPARAP